VTVMIQNWRLRNRDLEFFMKMEGISLLSTVGEVKVAIIHYIFAVGVFFWLFSGFMGKRVKR